MKSRWIFALLFLGVLLFQSCENEGIEPNEQKISVYGGTESHNTGQSCMACHVQGGSGEGWFNVAGTVYDSLKTNPYPNATIKLFTEPGGAGTLAYTIQVDALGNFYTTESIEFGGGLYVSTQGSQSTKHMQSIVTNGDCNSCHGNSVDKIWVN